MPGRVNFLFGSQLERQRKNLPAFESVIYRQLYPGVDMLYDGQTSHLKSEFRIAAGIDSSLIRIRYEGAKRPHVDNDGALVLSTPAGVLRERAPYAYQETLGGQSQIGAEYHVFPDGTVGFRIGEYDRALPIVIDPVMEFSTYFGGSAFDAVTSIAVDRAGNSYFAGWTESSDIPVANPRQAASGGRVDAFVGKLSPGGTLIYATYLGGSGDDRAFGISCDGDGDVYVTGWTDSDNFPSLNAAQRFRGGGRDAFVVRLNATGNSVVYGTYLGGSANDSGNAIALDALGNAYIAGETVSANFPAVQPLQQFGAGRQEAFTAKLSPSGTLLFATYLGGSGDDRASGIAVDRFGNAIIVGSTESFNFPVKNAFQGASGGGQDAFVAKLAAGGSALVYGTYLGGRGGSAGLPEMAAGVAVDQDGNAYVTGTTSSADFPVRNALYPVFAGGGTDAFAVKVDPAGAVVFGTYLGGTSLDSGGAVAVDAVGRAYIAGYTASWDWPGVSPLQSGNAGVYDVFVIELAAAGDALVFSTCLGGSNSDSGNGIVVSDVGDIYVAGQTLSHDFPLANALQARNPGNFGGFIAKLKAQSHRPQVSMAPASGSGASQTFTLLLSDADGAADITGANLIFNGGLTGVHACYLVYDHSQGRLYLVNDESSGTLGPVAPGAAGKLENSRCALDTGLSSVAASGNTVTLKLALTFKLLFAGTQSVYALTYDKGRLDTGWQQLGSWTVPQANRPPAPASIAPSSGNGLTQTFALTLSDPDGAADVGGVYVIFNAGLTGVRGCYIIYDHAQSRLYLANDDSTAVLGPLAPGVSGALKNSRCTVNMGLSSTSAAGNTVILRLALTFDAAFAGTQSVYALAYDKQWLDSGWRAVGSWTIGQSNRQPAAVSITPGSGAGDNQAFTLAVSDPDGAADIAGVAVIFNWGLFGGNACYMVYDSLQPRLYLVNDDSTATLGPIAPGNPGTLQNSRCALDIGQSRATVSGNTLSLQLALAFKPAFAGTQYVYVLVYDKGGLNNGWQQLGSWTIGQPNRAPTAVSMSPISGGGTSRTFTVTLSDPDGATDIGGASLIFSWALSGRNACYTIYDHSLKSLYLANDESTAVLGPVTPGTPGTIENSQCLLDAPGSSVSAVGENLFLRLAVTFKPFFAGLQNVYTAVWDKRGLDSAWKHLGTWEVPR